MIAELRRGIGLGITFIPADREWVTYHRLRLALVLVLELRWWPKSARRLV